ncbi:MAG: phage tail assembly protein [Acidobacteria bacterium]|nr:phage tail assembly protein [Acidobacteriota bacterium]
MIKRVESRPFRLHPGVIIGDRFVDECVVTILTRGEKKALEKEPEAVREDTAIAWSIIRLGDLTDRTLILSAINDLADVDVSRITQQIAKLEADCFEAGEVQEPAIRRIVTTTDIVSQPFALNPGITVNGKEQKSCIVRLLRRGEVKQMQAQKDEMLADDMFFRFVIVQIGEVISLTNDDIDKLTDGDIQRIQEAYAELRAQYAPESKSLDD